MQEADDPHCHYEIKPLKADKENKITLSKSLIYSLRFLFTLRSMFSQIWSMFGQSRRIELPWWCAAPAAGRRVGGVA
jgi:hypothetical protein